MKLFRYLFLCYLALAPEVALKAINYDTLLKEIESKRDEWKQQLSFDYKGSGELSFLTWQAMKKINHKDDTGSYWLARAIYPIAFYSTLPDPALQLRAFRIASFASALAGSTIQKGNSVVIDSSCTPTTIYSLLKVGDKLQIAPPSSGGFKNKTFADMLNLTNSDIQQLSESVLQYAHYMNNDAFADAQGYWHNQLKKADSTNYNLYKQIDEQRQKCIADAPKGCGQDMFGMCSSVKESMCEAAYDAATSAIEAVLSFVKAIDDGSNLRKPVSDQNYNC